MYLAKNVCLQSEKMKTALDTNNSIKSFGEFYAFRYNCIQKNHINDSFYGLIKIFIKKMNQKGVKKAW